MRLCQYVSCCRTYIVLHINILMKFPIWGSGLLGELISFDTSMYASGVCLLMPADITNEFDCQTFNVVYNPVVLPVRFTTDQS